MSVRRANWTAQFTAWRASAGGNGDEVEEALVSRNNPSCGSQQSQAAIARM